jgi:hypothetical protein
MKTGEKGRHFVVKVEYRTIWRPLMDSDLLAWTVVSNEGALIYITMPGNLEVLDIEL